MQKLNRWDLINAVRRLPPATRTLLEKQGLLMFAAGGFIRSAIKGERINDVDLFCASKEYADVVGKEFAGGRHYIETENALTFKTSPTTQIITRWTFSNPSDCVLSFDFTICQAAIWYDPVQKSWDSVCTDEYYPDLAANRLVYTKPQRIEEVGGSTLRVLKYYQRGYRMPLDSLAAVLARLMTGVDFNTLTRFHCNDNGQVDEAWMAKIILGLLREVDPLTRFDTMVQAAFDKDEGDVKVVGDQLIDTMQGGGTIILDEANTIPPDLLTLGEEMAANYIADKSKPQEEDETKLWSPTGFIKSIDEEPPSQ